MFSISTVRGKLTIGFGLLAIMVLLVATFSLRALSHENDRFEDYVTGINARADVASDVRMAVDRRAIAARNLVLVTKDVDLDAERAEVQRAHTDVVAGLNELNAMIDKGRGVEDRAKVLVAEMNQVEQSYGPVALAIVDLALKGRHAEAIAKMNDECRPLLAKLVASSGEYAKYARNRAKEITEEAAHEYAKQRILLISVCLLSFVSAILAGAVITRSLTRSLGAEPIALGEAAQRIADGDLGTIAGADTAQRGSVMASLGAMQASLATIVGQVRGASDSIATGSSEIATGNADLSQRTEEQASALQQTSATMMELGNTVRVNADSAAQANQLALGASRVATHGGEVVSQVVATMKGINDSSKKIADIIGVIDGIAFQTNILALNAAVEAARAGEQGRGFAVVAGEVRNLAQRSAAAAKEIKGLITDSVDRVGEGTALVDKAGATMMEIVTSIKRVTDIVGEISAASGEQSAGVAQVGQAVSQMDQVTQQNAALVEESAAAAESLKLQAERLVAAVAVFRLGRSQAGSASGFSPVDEQGAARPAEPSTAPTRRVASFVPQRSSDEWQAF